MLLDQLFEDAEDDLRRSQLANRFIDNLVSYIHKQEKAGRDISKLRKYVVSRNEPDGYPGLVSDEFGFEGGMLRGVLVCFRHNDYPETSGSAAPVDAGHELRFVVQMDVNASDMRSLMFSVSSERGRTVLMHEIAHVIDYIRYKDKNGIKKREIVRVKKAGEEMTPEERIQHRQKEISVYHNDPLERNAFFHNMAEPLLLRMRYLQRDSMALEFLDPISRDFREYFNSTLKKKYGIIGQHWDNVSEEGKRRIVSRLNNLFTLFWKSLDAHEAAKAKYSQDNSTEVPA